MPSEYSSANVWLLPEPELGVTETAAGGEAAGEERRPHGAVEDRNALSQDDAAGWDAKDYEVFNASIGFKNFVSDSGNCPIDVVTT